ncbi:MAG: D-alanyl-D-alanine carboxypeptidase [Ruminococcaceae bacterium]|nr:D-alanyl-D-alanine carboxypeptidase [Oscillospiraceae bacterium]
MFSVFLFICMILSVLPVKAYAAPSKSPQNAPKLDCKSAILMEADTGTVLYESSADNALPPASVTKVMTLLLVMEAIEAGKINYSDKVRASANACSMGGSQIYLEENEEMSVEDLLKSVVIASANDAAVALAEYVSGTEEAFVARMNERASELGMKNTRFENTNGLDDSVEDHVTSARDIAIMSRELIKYPRIIEFSSIWMDTIRNGEFGLTNTNRLIRFYKGATGLKTGSTSKAGFCISATAERDGMTLICVIMGAPSRDVRNAAATSLLDWGFSNYGLYTVEGGNISDIPVLKGVRESVGAQYSGFSQILEKNGKKNVEKIVELPETLTAPIKKGDVVGKVLYKLDGKEVGRSDIIALQNVEEISFGKMFLIFLEKCAQIM